jgi:hypothetical protein
MKIALRIALLLTLVGSARADVLTFPTLHLARGYKGPLVLDVTWDGVSARNVTTVTGTLTVYSKPPLAGVGGTVLFAKALTPTGIPTNRLACNLVPTDTALPGAYYAEVALTELGGDVVDVVHGVVAVEGR